METCGYVQGATPFSYLRRRPASVIGHSGVANDSSGTALEELIQPGPIGTWARADARLRCRYLNVGYGGKQALHDVVLDIGASEVLALIGPSGCGKSTFLRCLNRMNDLVVGCKVVGEVSLQGRDIYETGVDLVNLRARVGMVFQRPNPFPISIFENVAYGLRIHGLASTKEDLWVRVERALRRVGLWSEVKDVLSIPATSLSVGQQQRLCIARTVALNPEVILMDEPCSALDPIASGRVEQLIAALGKQFSVVIVTHSMQQAARVSRRTGYFHMGRLVEVADTADLFTRPRHALTEAYISGRFG